MPYDVPEWELQGHFDPIAALERFRIRSVKWISMNGIADGGHIPDDQLPTVNEISEGKKNASPSLLKVRDPPLLRVKFINTLTLGKNSPPIKLILRKLCPGFVLGFRLTSTLPISKVASLGNLMTRNIRFPEYSVIMNRVKNLQSL